MAVIAPRHDGRAVAAAVVVTGALVIGIGAGRPAMVAFAAPFAVALLVGLRRVRPQPVDVVVDAPARTFLEGDEIELAIRVERAADLHVALRFDFGPGVGAIADDPPVRFLPAGTTTATVRVRAEAWGRHHTGVPQVTAWTPGGLVVWEGRAGDGARVRVLPQPVRLRQLLDPDHARVLAGVHPSRAVGDGTDFAEIRPWSPGDRVRHLNRRASARRGEPLVNRFHPDRAGEVVLLIDTFGDAGWASASLLEREAIALAARAAWALARQHLAAHDRVGFLSYGRLGSWLPPAGGDRARYRLLATLLDLGGDIADGATRWGLHPERIVPPDALVVVFTPLWRTPSLGPLVQLRRAGCTVAAVVVDPSRLIAPAASPLAAEADHLWAMQLEERRRMLVAAGVDAVPWRAGADVGTAIAHLRRLAHGTRTGHGARR